MSSSHYSYGDDIGQDSAQRFKIDLCCRSVSLVSLFRYVLYRDGDVDGLDLVLFDSHYIKKDGLVVMCMADEKVGRKMPFAFLADVLRSVRSFFPFGQQSLISERRHRQFSASHPPRSFRTTSTPPLPFSFAESYGQELEGKMESANKDPQAFGRDPVKVARDELSDVKECVSCVCKAGPVAHRQR